MMTLEVLITWLVELSFPIHEATYRAAMRPPTGLDSHIPSHEKAVRLATLAMIRHLLK